MAKIVSICRLIQLSLSSVLKIYFVLAQVELIYFVLVATFDFIALAVSYTIAYYIKTKSLFFKYFRLECGKTTIKDSGFLFISNLTVLLILNIDKIIVKIFLGLEDLGFYSVALQLSSLIVTAAMIVGAALAPKLVNEFKNQTNYQVFKQKFFFYSSISFGAVSFFVINVFQFNS